MEQVENVILISFRPFTYPANKYRFQLLSLLKEYSPKARMFVMGNYFQLKSDEFNSCLNLMFQKRSPSASICIENSNDYNPSIEKKELKSKLIDKKDLDYKFISLFELLRNNDGTYEHEYKSVPFMYDWNHLNTTFIDYIGLRLKNYNGKDENILRRSKLRVATRYVSTAKTYFESIGIQPEIIELLGSIMKDMEEKENARDT